MPGRRLFHTTQINGKIRAAVICLSRKAELGFCNGTNNGFSRPESAPMPPTVPCSLAALAVAAIFYTYRTYQDFFLQRQKSLRERVAYMLWCAANAA